jgi:hypothetical protein
MKKIAFLLLVALSMNTFAKKDISDKTNRIGFNLGFSANSVKFEGQTEQQTKNLTKVGGMIGLTFEHKFGKTFALETGVNFLNKGGRNKIQSNIISNGGNSSLNFYSLDVPLIAKLYIGKKKIFNINFGGYVSYSYLIQLETKEDFKYTADVNNKVKNPEDTDGNKMFKPFDAGINFGAEFISRKGIGAGFKLNQGLIDATNNDFGGVANDKKYALHTGAQLYMIFKF